MDNDAFYKEKLEAYRVSQAFTVENDTYRRIKDELDSNKLELEKRLKPDLVLVTAIFRGERAMLRNNYTKDDILQDVAMWAAANLYYTSWGITHKRMLQTYKDFLTNLL